MNKTPHQLLRDGSTAARHFSSLSASQCLAERDANRLVGKIIAGLKAGLKFAPQSETVLDASAAGFRLAHHVAHRDLEERTADHLLRKIHKAFDLLLPLGEPASLPPEVSPDLLTHLRAHGLQTGRSLARMSRETAAHERPLRKAVLDWSPPSDLQETVERMRAVIEQLPTRTRTVGRFPVIDGGLA